MIQNENAHEQSMKCPVCRERRIEEKRIHDMNAVLFNPRAEKAFRELRDRVKAGYDH